VGAVSKPRFSFVRGQPQCSHARGLTAYVKLKMRAVGGQAMKCCAIVTGAKDATREKKRCNSSISQSFN
jgi:hypothetical protein